VVPAAREGFWWRHGWLVKMLAILALAWGVCYLTWRIGWSGRGASPGLFVALLAAEVFGWVSLAFYAFLAWSIPETQRPKRLSDVPSVDIFVCTYDETERVVEPTLIGCRAVEVPHTTYLLDDGHRPEMKVLAARLGAVYITRPDNAHAKAGNINHALKVTHGELILMLDADHVPLPHVLDATVGYFADSSVALVQTPHDFSNRDSVQHTKVARHEQTLFYEVIAPGKDRHNAMFWCGSATIVRRAALESIGGVLTDTVAEDFHTTIAMHAQRWRTRYHDETLVQGLAPHNLSGFLLQRARWARGNLAVFRTRQNPLTCRGLTAKQRLSYSASLFSYFSALQRLVLLVVLTTMLVSGRLPMHVSAALLVALWLPWSILAFTATLALGRGTLGAFDSTRYGLMTMGINIRGAVALLSPKAGRFKVTPKEGIDEGGLQVFRLLGVVSAAGIALAVAVSARLLATIGAVELPPMSTFVTVIGVVLGLWELGCIVKVFAPLVRRRQQRTRHRTQVVMRARLDGTTMRVDVRDLTPEGVSFVSPVELPLTGRVTLLTRIPDHLDVLHDVAMTVEVVKCRQLENYRRFAVGGPFVDLDGSTRERLIEFCDVVLPCQRLGQIAVGDPVEDWHRPAATSVRDAS
jgi:cellulose synthase (UDP-forming)